MHESVEHSAAFVVVLVSAQWRFLTLLLCLQSLGGVYQIIGTLLLKSGDVGGHVDTKIRPSYVVQRRVEISNTQT